MTSKETVPGVIPWRGTELAGRNYIRYWRDAEWRALSWAMARSALQVFDIRATDTVLSFLPYAHVLERIDSASRC